MSQETNGTHIQKSVEDDEIDLLALVRTLWDGRKTVIKTTVVFMIIGLFIAILSPKEFTASTTIVPASEGKNGGNLGGLAALAGINLGGSSESGISPTLYPQITSSIPFQKELLKTPLTFEGQKTQITYQDYYTKYSKPGLLSILKKYTIGLPGLFIKAIKGKPSPVRDLNQVGGSNLLTITEDENDLIKQLDGQIVLGVDKKDDVISLSFNMPEALPAAEMAQKTQELL